MAVTRWFSVACDSCNKYLGYGGWPTLDEAIAVAKRLRWSCDRLDGLERVAATCPDCVRRREVAGIGGRL